MILLGKLILKAVSDLVEKASKEYINIGSSCNLIVLQRKLDGSKLCAFFPWRESGMYDRNHAFTLIVNG